jgi:predicted short-subunit dehydrogenase-like oxidoreductase (DUF2520 family)
MTGVSSNMKVFILGAGKVGRALAKEIRAAKMKVVLRRARDGAPSRRIDADVIVIAVRDRQITPLAEKLAQAQVVPRRAVCVHVAGALDATPLAPLRPVCAGVAQMHPMISFAALSKSPTLSHGHVHVQGDPIAVKRAAALVRKLGMTPRTFPRLDAVGYHAAAGLVANGAAALAALGAELLARSGVPRKVAPAMLGPLLRSVADNVEALGFPESLTGPVRRGEAASVEKHLRILRERLPEAVPLFVASGRAQLPLARAIGEAPPDAFDAVEGALASE